VLSPAKKEGRPLIERIATEPIPELVPDFDNKVVIVTGGTGSFGQRCVERLIANFRPHKVIVFSRDEAKLFDMANREPFRSASNVRFFIGDVRDVARLEMAFREVDYVIHAAALKQVPAAEYNPFECIRTNVHGAENVVTAAIRTGVKRVVALSTDKAVNPINLYGASKLASDKIFVAAKWLVGNTGHPIFAVVRYGNVIGSRGSVVPHFHKLIGEGAQSLPITDVRMTRFWITVDQGVDFLLSCLPLMQGGEIFVPKIPSMRVVDVARTMSPTAGTHIIGIRPGEKIHEVLITEEDARMTLELPDRYVVRPTLYGEYRTYHPEERPVAEDFCYTSANNSRWLDPNALSTALTQLGLAVKRVAAE
jgi:UDP-N-acetylglucosamine 4,6-dehydratase